MMSITLPAQDGGEGVQRGGALRLGQFAEPQPVAGHHRHRQVGPRRLLGAVELVEHLAALLGVERFQEGVGLRHGIGDHLIAARHVARNKHGEGEQPDAAEGRRQPQCARPPRSAVQQFLESVSAHGGSSMPIHDESWTDGMGRPTEPARIVAGGAEASTCARVWLSRARV
jgi:hypothetical protein